MYFRYRFRIAPEVSLDGFALPMSYFADNSVPEAWVNGVAQSPFQDSLPQSSDTYFYAGFREATRAETVLSNGFQHGLNTIYVRVGSGGPSSNMGLMAQMSPAPLCSDTGDAPNSYGTIERQRREPWPRRVRRRRAHRRPDAGCLDRRRRRRSARRRSRRRRHRRCRRRGRTSTPWSSRQVRRPPPPRFASPRHGVRSDPAGLDRHPATASSRQRRRQRSTCPPVPPWPS